MSCEFRGSENSCPVLLRYTLDLKDAPPEDICNQLQIKMPLFYLFTLDTEREAEGLPPPPLTSTG